MGDLLRVRTSSHPLTLKQLVNFTQWAGLGLCQVCGVFLNDRIPLWISRRRGGAWHLEYRLYPILIVAAVSPIGFGIFGAGIQYARPYTTPHTDTSRPLTYPKQGTTSTTWSWPSAPSSSSSPQATAPPYRSTTSSNASRPPRLRSPSS